MKERIPKAVRDAARETTCNGVRYEGELNGVQVYSEIHKVGSDGLFTPTGTPHLLLWDGESLRHVSGGESLTILDSLQRPTAKPINLQERAQLCHEAITQGIRLTDALEKYDLTTKQYLDFRRKQTPATTETDEKNTKR